MKSIIFLSSALVALAFIATTEGLKCYECSYTDIDGTIVGDESCKSGKTPNEKFLGECRTQSGYKTMCVKVTSEAKENGKKAKLTARTCVGLANSGDTSTRCEDEIYGIILGTTGKNATTKADVSYKGNVCVCDTDKCNSSSFVKVSSGLMVLSVIVALFKH